MRKPFGWQFWLFLVVLIVILAGFVCPPVRKTNKSIQKEATSNLRQIGLSLHDFEEKFGAFPNDDTAALVLMKHSGSGHNLTGSSSNAMNLKPSAIKSAAKPPAALLRGRAARSPRT